VTALHLLLLAHALSTVMMAGLIWFVQHVHYPLMAMVGADGFPAYEREHQRRTGHVVAPLMLVEASTAVALVVLLPDGPPRLLAWSGLVLVVAIWLSTWRLQVPCHRHLEAGADERVIRRLVATNRLRTAAWSVRAVVALVLLADLGS
jgi:hypothetical protein